MKTDLKRVSGIINACLPIYTLGRFNLIDYIDHCIKTNITFKKLDYKRLDDAVLLEDLSAELEDDLFENSVKCNVSVLFENSYDNAVVGTLAGYNPRTKRIYVVTDDFFYKSSIADMSITELRYLAVNLAKYIQEKK